MAHNIQIMKTSVKVRILVFFETANGRLLIRILWNLYKYADLTASATVFAVKYAAIRIKMRIPQDSDH